MTGQIPSSGIAMLSRAQVFAALVCACVLGTDLAEIALGNGLSAVFSAAPYQLDARSLAWILSAVYVGAVVGAPCLGWVADRVGSKATIVAALGWLGVVSCITGADGALGHLPTLRMLAGLSLGALPPLVITYLTGLSPPRSRGVVILWVSALSFLAGPATIFAVRALVKTNPFGVEGWRWPFLIAGAIALLLSALFTRLPGVRQSNRLCPQDLPTASGSPPGPAQLTRRFAFLGSLYFLHPWASVGFSITVGPTLIERGYDLTSTLFYVGMSLFGPAVTTFLAGTVADRFDRRYTLAASCGAMLVACVLFFGSTSPALLLAAVVLFGIAVGFYLPLMTTYGAEIFPGRVRGSATSGAWALNRLAAFLVPLALLPLLHSAGAATVATVICTCATISAILLVFVGPRSGSRSYALE